ncbi:DUF7282 domain-containing protein [Halorientalis pallida]|uniref:DUF7282 domain-containing protein n=1 Tax=Halorientalis pallida TaxID=2479928 RepID=A0A498KSZ7_9EURY|nr:hypothetical protein [Halorientalis pallida]RXK47215.1 hypothetical protein EAF64_15620 [Halorientalis pallida]
MRTTVVLAGLVALAVVGAGLVVAHGNHATASPQVSTDGTVVVEEAFLSTDGYLVLRADDGGEPGRIVGVRPLDRGRHRGVTVRADDAFWTGVRGNVTLWAVLHADAEAGNDFDPAADTMLTWFGGPAGQRLAVARGERPASVVTRGAGALENGTLPVVAATLPEAGSLVVHATANGTLGRSLGSRALPAGRHTGVRVSVNTSGLDERAVVAVAVHTDDGDGRFEPGVDPVVRVAGEPVASRYERVPEGRDPIRVNTPVPTTDSAGDSEAADGPATTDSSAETSADGAGPGAWGVALAVAVIAAWLARRQGM